MIKTFMLTAVMALATVVVTSTALAQSGPDCDAAALQYGDCDETEVTVIAPDDPPSQPEPPADGGIDNEGDFIGDFPDVDLGDLDDVLSDPDSRPTVVAEQPDPVPATPAPATLAPATPAPATTTEPVATPAPVAPTAPVAPAPVAPETPTAGAAEEAGMTTLPNTSGQGWLLPAIGGLMISLSLLLRTVFIKE